MRTKYLFILLVFAMCISVSAQIKVESNGHVGIGGEPNSYWLNVDGSACFSGVLWANSKIYANYIYPKTGDGTAYLKVGNSYTEATLRIEGYGERALDINGNIYQWGNLLQASDVKLKKEIKTISGSSILDRISSLDAKEYKFKSKDELLELQRSGLSSYKQDTLDLYKEAQKLMKSNYDKYPKFRNKVLSLSEVQVDSIIQHKYIAKVKKKYSILDSLDNNRIVVVDVPSMDTTTLNFGFLAQEVEPVFPNLVKMDSTTGMYAVNYIGFIPVNFQAIKELKAENDELRAELEKIKAFVGMNKLAKSKSATISFEDADGDDESVEGFDSDMVVESQGATLFQNNPNPFSESTTINYYLPQETKDASIYLYDINGRQIKHLKLRDTGSGSLQLSSEDLYAGLFTYALIVDGKLVGTKKMVLTE